MKLKYRKTKMKYMVAETFKVDCYEIIEALTECGSTGNNVEWIGNRIHDREGGISIDIFGVLTITAGQYWDGASGPTRDSKKSKRGSLTHDMLYRLMRQGKLPQFCRGAADGIFYRLLREDGMWRIRAWFWYRAVKRFAGAFVDPDSIAEVFST